MHVFLPNFSDMFIQLPPGFNNLDVWMQLLLTCPKLNSSNSSLAVLGRQSNALHCQDVYILISGICEYIRFHGQGELKLQMEFELLIS